MNHLGLTKIEQAKQAIEKMLNMELQPSYDSREDDNEDEENGHFVDYSIDIEEDQEPLVIEIYENGKVQLFHDATPYPVSANTPDESRMMMLTLCPAPVDFQSITIEDYNTVVEKIKENF